MKTRLNDMSAFRSYLSGTSISIRVNEVASSAVGAVATHKAISVISWLHSYFVVHDSLVMRDGYPFRKESTYLCAPGEHSGATVQGHNVAGEYSGTTVQGKNTRLRVIKGVVYRKIVVFVRHCVGNVYTTCMRTTMSKHHGSQDT